MWPFFSLLLHTTSTILAILFVVLNGFVAIFGLPKLNTTLEGIEKEKKVKRKMPFRLLDLPDVPARRVFHEFPNILPIYDLALTSKKFSNVLKKYDTTRIGREANYMGVTLDNYCDLVEILYYPSVIWRFMHTEPDFAETEENKIMRIVAGRKVEIYERASERYHHEYTLYTHDHTMTMLVVDYLLELMHPNMYEMTIKTYLDMEVVINSRAFLEVKNVRRMKCNALTSDQLEMLLDKGQQTNMTLEFDAPADFEYDRPIRCFDLRILKTDWLNSHIFLNLMTADTLDLFNVRSLTSRDFNLFIKKWAEKSEEELERSQFYWLAVESILPLDWDELTHGIEFATDQTRGHQWEGEIDFLLEGGQLMYIYRGNYLARLNFTRYKLSFSAHFDPIYEDHINEYNPDPDNIQFFMWEE